MPVFRDLYRLPVLQQIHFRLVVIVFKRLPTVFRPSVVSDRFGFSGRSHQRSADIMKLLMHFGMNRHWH